MNELTNTFPVVEIFGPTLQGEGALIGRQTLFVRLGGCDYRCSWCDSLHAVIPEQFKNAPRMTATQIVNQCFELANPKAAPWVTLSGGNPAIFKHGLEIVSMLRFAGYKVAIETQGSVYQVWLRALDHITISPKPPSSHLSSEESLQNFARFMGQLTRDIPSYTRKREFARVSIKIPIFDEYDLDFAESIVDYVDKNCIDVLHSQEIYLSVGNKVGEDTTSTLLDNLEWMFINIKKDPARWQHLNQRAVMLPQLHVLIWGNKQGV